MPHFFKYVYGFASSLNINHKPCFELGMGDLSGFMDKIQEVVPMDQQPELLQKLSEGNFTLRIMYEQFQNILKMGPIGQVIYLLCLIEFIINTSLHLTPTWWKKVSVIVYKNFHLILCTKLDGSCVVIGCSPIFVGELINC